MEQLKVVGKSVERKDGRAKVTGRARFAGDLVAPGMLHGKILRSPIAHGNILNIDTSKARALPGVMAVITGEDFPGKPYGTRPDTRDQLPMPISKVHHFGEGVAAVAAIDEDTAEEALDLIRVDYEELPVVLTAEDALRPGAPPVNEFKETNLAYYSDFVFGEVEEGFKKADYIRKETFTSQRVTVGFIEPHACLAEVDPSGRVLFQGSKQSPYITWRHMCRALDIPLSKMRIVNPFVGGAFSGKHDPFDVDFAAVRLAQITGRPVKIVLNYDEVLAAYRQRNAMDARLRLGVKKNGAITALEANCVLEGGPVCGIGPFNIYYFGAFLNIPYRIPAIKYHGELVYSNRAPCGTVRGQEIVLAQFALDSLLHMVGEEIGVDPVEMRVVNAVPDNWTTANGIVVDVSGLSRCIEKSAEIIGWKESRKQSGRGRGIGFSCASHPSGPRLGGHFGSSVVLKLVEDGKVIVTHGGTEIGQGCNTVFCQMVAEVLGLPIEDVEQGVSDSDTTIFDSGMFGDRCTYWDGNAAILAAEDLKRQLAEIAAKELNVDPKDLCFEDRRIYVRDQPEKGIGFLLAVRKAYYEKGAPLYGRGYWAATDIDIVDWKTGKGNLAHGLDFIATAIELEVDRETGQVTLLRSAHGDDAGQPINPLMLDGQVIGGSTHMIGHGLLEESLYDERGRSLNCSWRDYKQPTSMDVPFEAIVEHIHTRDPYGPFGAKGAGEASSCSTLAAIANGIYDAVGVRIRDLPITPEKILKALREKEGR
ncbi:MAG: molybdopterin-dependent oxidoreductase [Deltaproteobacteria bacterium]|nr:molybdopterin-dependent oxidoreductase [Deltaproteobacteria bacterium]MBW2137848.1 molybdopterin-dependent oxidoreductase [Deltaproteobacteria bacterium]